MTILTQSDIISEIERTLPVLGLQPRAYEWLLSQLATLKTAPSVLPTPVPQPIPAPAPQPVSINGNNAPSFGVGPGWQVSMNGTGYPNAWVPNVNGAPDWTGVVAAGNDSGPNSGIEGLTYAQMPADQAAAYVAAIKATGAQF